MWITVEKDKRTLPIYSFVFVLLLFFIIARLSFIKDVILCRTFKVCYTNTHKNQSTTEQLDKTFYLSSSLERDDNNNSFRQNFSSDIFLPRRKRKIIIYSLARSGSSFLGEIFNRREDVFYMYEPLHTVKTFEDLDMFPPSEYTAKASQMLEDVLGCQFQEYRDHLSFMSFPELCNPHFRLMSRVLSSPPFCKKHIGSNSTENEYRQNCNTLLPELMNKFCTRKENVVIKELVHRLPLQSLQGVLTLFKDKLFRMVCLIRDPRAVISSMKSMGGMGYNSTTFDTSVEAATNKVCATLINHYHSLNIPDLLIRSKLIAVRYEDIVSRPEYTIRTLFSFLNLNIDEDTVQWVIHNTHGRTNNTVDNFSVFLRNVTYSLNSWRRLLTFDQVRSIQRKCGNVMKKFGYVLYYNKEDVWNLNMPTFNSSIEIDNIVRIM